MADNVIDSLLVEIGVDLDALDKGLERADRAVNTFQQSVKEVSKPLDEMVREYKSNALIVGNVSEDVAQEILKVGTASQKASLIAGRAFDSINKKSALLKSVVTRFIAPLAAAFAGSQIWNSFSQGGEKLSDLSDRIGVNVQKLDMWAKANRDAGGSAEAFHSALENWTNGLGRSSDSFFRLGKSIEGMNNRQAAFYLQNIGLSNEAAAVFIKYKGAADQAAESYRGLTITAEQAKRAKEFNVLWRRFTDQVAVFGNAIIMFVLPPMKLFIGIFDKVIKFTTKHDRFLKMMFIGLGALIGGSFVLNVIKGAGALGTLTKGVGLLTKASRILLATLVANPFAAAIAAVTALILVIEDLYAFFTGAPSVTGVIVDAIVDAFGTAWKVVSNWFDNILSLFSNFGQRIKDAVGDWFSGAKNLLGDIFVHGDDEGTEVNGREPSQTMQGMAAASGIVSNMSSHSNVSNTNNNSNVQVQAYISTPADPEKVGQAVGRQVRQSVDQANNIVTNNQTGVVQKG